MLPAPQNAEEFAAMVAAPRDGGISLPEATGPEIAVNLVMIRLEKSAPAERIVCIVRALPAGLDLSVESGAGKCANLGYLALRRGAIWSETMLRHEIYQGGASDMSSAFGEVGLVFGKAQSIKVLEAVGEPTFNIASIKVRSLR